MNRPACATTPLASTLLGPVAAALLGAVGFSAPAAAQTVQITPMVSYRTGGSFATPVQGKVVHPDGSLTFGGMLDLSIKPTWRVELSYSRQDTEVEGFGRNLDVTIENYLIGLQEERGAEEGAKTRPFGTILFGATRFVPGDFDATTETRPAAGFALGLKLFPAKNFGLRFEGRGIMTFVTSSGGALCGNGTCYLNYSGSSFWQWEFLGGATIAF